MARLIHWEVPHVPQKHSNLGVRQNGHGCDGHGSCDSEEHWSRTYKERTSQCICWKSSLLRLSTIISLNDEAGAPSSLKGFSPSEALPSELLACFQLATHGRLQTLCFLAFHGPRTLLSMIGTKVPKPCNPQGSLNLLT